MAATRPADRRAPGVPFGCLNIVMKGTNAICRDSRSHHALKSIGAAYIAFVWMPCRRLFFFSSPLLCQPVSKLHIHLSDSYNLPVMHLCTPSQCASSRPWCLKFSGKNKPLCTYLNLKVPHYAKLTFTNVPHGSLPLRKRD